MDPSPFRESEVINLFLAVVSLLIFRTFYRAVWIPQRGLLWTGAGCIISAYVFTVLEGLFWPAVFDVLEHISYAAAGVCFAAACRQTMRMQERVKKVR
jgi:hypothetical protein